MVWRTVLASFRIPFLLLSLACVLLAVACARYAGLSVNSVHLVLAGVGAVLAHIAVNALNEYQDFRSGLDFHTRRTPFSGGSGALPGDAASAPAVRRAAFGALLLTLLIGIYFLLTYGWRLLVIGVPGVGLILTYTHWLNRRPWLCLLAPGTGFGLLMVAGTHFVATGAFTPVVWVAAALVFLLVNNLLLLNQFPDIDADRSVGRRHFPIAYGTRISGITYGIFVLIAMLVLALAAHRGLLPPAAYLLLLPLAVGLYVMSGAIRFGQDLVTRTHYLALNVLLVLLVPTLLSVLMLTAA